MTLLHCREWLYCSRERFQLFASHFRRPPSIPARFADIIYPLRSSFLYYYISNNEAPLAPALYDSPLVYYGIEEIDNEEEDVYSI